MDIPKGKYLGTLCKRGHEWENSGKSLRFRSDCLECKRIRGLINREGYKDRCNELARIRRDNAYYKKEWVIRRESTKKWLAVNPNYYRERSVRERISLADPYIKRSIIQKSKLKFKDVPLQLVELKRIHMKISRLIKEMKNGKQ